MKKIFALLLALSLVLALAACVGDKPSGDRISIPPPAGTQSETPGGQENPPDSTPDTSTPDASGDTVTLVKKEGAYNYIVNLSYVEEMTLTFDGDTVVKCSIKEIYADEESAKAAEEGYKSVEFYTNLTRNGNAVSYDYSEDWCNDSFELFKGKDMTIKHFTEDKGYTLQ